jgi:hypothetical protein
VSAVLAFAVSRTFGAQLDGSKSDDSSGRIWGDGHEHVVLVKITDVSCGRDAKTNQRTMTYSADVIFDMDGSLAGKTIVMSGELDNFNAGFDTAKLTVDDISAIHIQPQDKTSVFRCMPWMHLSIGLQTNIALHLEDMVPVETAMKAAIDHLPLKEKSREKAELFLKDQNYFLWALGVEMIAQEHTKESFERLKYLVNDDLSKPQFLWLNQTIGEVDPGDSDHRIRIQNNLYFNYLSKGVKYPAEFTP